MTGTEALPLLRTQLVRLAHYRLGDQHAAEDVAQETLTRLIASRHTFTSTAHLTGWAVTTTKNLCADHVRQRNRYVPQDEHVWAARCGAADEPTLSRDLVDTILAALGEIPERQAAVLLAAARLGSADRSALAEATGETENAVRNYLHRGRAVLRSKLAAAGHGVIGLVPLRGVLRSAQQRRVVTAGLLIPSLAMLTIILRPLLSAPQPSPTAERGRSVNDRLRPPRPTGTATPSRADRPPAHQGSLDDQQPWTVVLSPPSPLPVQIFVVRNGQVCGVRTVVVDAGKEGCGVQHDPSSAYLEPAVQVPGHEVGIYAGNLRCADVPTNPVLLCSEDSPSPSPSPSTSPRATW